jgi:hypothetical protein
MVRVQVIYSIVLILSSWHLACTERIISVTLELDSQIAEL